MQFNDSHYISSMTLYVLYLQNPTSKYLELHLNAKLSQKRHIKRKQIDLKIEISKTGYHYINPSSNTYEHMYVCTNYFAIQRCAIVCVQSYMYTTYRSACAIYRLNRLCENQPSPQTSESHPNEILILFVCPAEIRRLKSNCHRMFELSAVNARPSHK